MAYLLYGKTLEGETAKDCLAKAEQYLTKAEDLGVTKLSNKNYVAEQEKAQARYREKQKEG